MNHQDYLVLDGHKSLRLVSDATCWVDSMVSPFDARTAAASLTLAALVGGLYAPRFDLNDEIFGSIQFNHNIKTSGSVIIYPHIHLVNKNLIGAVNYNLKFEFEYAWGNHSSTALSATVNDPQTFSIINAAAYYHHLFNFTAITAGASQGGISSMFFWRTKRISAAAAAYDTNDIFFAGFDIHYEVDSLGSDNVASKSY